MIVFQFNNRPFFFSLFRVVMELIVFLIFLIVCERTGGSHRDGHGSFAGTKAGCINPFGYSSQGRAEVYLAFSCHHRIKDIGF